MSEFDKEDAARWLRIAYQHSAPIQDAIYYDLFWACRRDDCKLARAVEFFEREYGLKTDKIAEGPGLPI